MAVSGGHHYRRVGRSGRAAVVLSVCILSDEHGEPLVDGTAHLQDY